MESCLPLFQMSVGRKSSKGWLPAHGGNNGCRSFQLQKISSYVSYHLWQKFTLIWISQHHIEASWLTCKRWAIFSGRMGLMFCSFWAFWFLVFGGTDLPNKECVYVFHHFACSKHYVLNHTFKYNGDISIIVFLRYYPIYEVKNILFQATSMLCNPDWYTGIHKIQLENEDSSLM